MIEAGELERIAHGLYQDPNEFNDPYVEAQHTCRQGIFSNVTALYFHDLSDQTPLRLMLTIPSGYNCRLLKDKKGFKFFYLKPELHEMGISTVITPFGHAVKVYDLERTICDCIKMEDHLDKNTVVQALKAYFGYGVVDYATLLGYAEKLKIRKRVKMLMEVLT